MLVLTVPFPKLIAPSLDSAIFSDGNTEKTHALELLTEVRLSIGVCLDSVVLETVRTAGPDASVPPSGSRGASCSSIPGGVVVNELDARRMQQIQIFSQRLGALPSSLRDRLFVAMQRWHDSRLHYGPTPDLFIDVGVGLESVFLPEESTELKHRLAVRGGRLLGGATAESRIRMAKILETLYDARSHAVHKGRLLKKVKRDVAENVEHLAMISPVILRNSILAMIDRARDDWDTLVFA